MVGFVERVARYIVEENLLEADALTVVGVSGGVDSMVLLEVLVRLDYPVVAAHVNYGLRGEAANADEALVRRRCGELQVAVESARYDTHTLAAGSRRSIQEVARDLRYAFFARVAEAAGARHVAVAHHADDQAETVLLHLFRGTGIDGLGGMAPARSLSADAPILLVRPFLRERRSAIESFARTHQVPWREDAGNDSDEYLRTHIRRSLIPGVEEKFGRDVIDRIGRTAEIVRAYTLDILSPELQMRFDACAEVRPRGGLLREEGLRNEAPLVRTRLILAALERWLPAVRRDAATALRIAGLLDAQVGRSLQFGSGEVWRERDGIWFVQAGAGLREDHREVAVPLREGTYAVPGGNLAVRLETPPIDVRASDEWTAVLDVESAAGPFRVRPWRAGDMIDPLGMGGRTRKVSDVLTDVGVPSHSRKRTIVVCSGSRVAWIPGVRLAEFARTTPETRRAWVLTFVPDAN